MSSMKNQSKDPKTKMNKQMKKHMQNPPKPKPKKMRGVRLNDDLWERIQWTACEVGLTASEWIRQTIIEKLIGENDD